MASMGYDRDTLSLMLSIAEERMETDLSESDYLKICNALKDLNNRMPSTTTSGTNQPVVRRITPVRISSGEYVEVEDAMRTIAALDRRRSELLDEMWSLSASRLTITMLDKQNVIEGLVPEAICRGPRGGIKNMSKNTIESWNTYIVANGILTSKREFEDRVREQAIERKRRTIFILRQETDTLTRQIEDERRRTQTVTARMI